jgi:hypothetical protein
MSALPSGSIGLTVGQVEVQISPPSFLAENFAFDYLYVENLVESNPIAIRPVPGVRIRASGNIIGVMIELSAAPDSGNYVLRWGIA